MDCSVFTGNIPMRECQGGIMHRRATKILVGLSLIFSGCSGILSRRSFINVMEEDKDGFFQPGRDFQILAGDTGHSRQSREDILRRTPAGEKDLLLKKELKAREESLSPREYTAYRNAERYFENDSVRTYYLSLSPGERKNYLAYREEAAHRKEQEMMTVRTMRSPSSLGNPLSSASLKYAYEREKIGLGMSKDKVRNLWGMPNSIEIAGDPREQNERWVFHQRGRTSYIYFEGGLVGGWMLE